MTAEPKVLTCMGCGWPFPETSVHLCPVFKFDLWSVLFSLGVLRASAS